VAHLYWTVGAAPLAGLSLGPPTQPLGELSPASGALTVLDEAQRGMQLSHDAPPVVRTLDGRYLFGREEGDLPDRPLVVGALSRYDLQTRTFAPLVERGAFNALALSPDGQTLAVSRGTEIDLYSVRELIDAGPLHR
jgi:sugar lactone lactonase YvrE